MCGFDKMGADNVKGSGRQICPASPCSMRGAIQRAEKGSGFRTVSFEATEAPWNQQNTTDSFHVLYSVDFENASPRVMNT